MLAVIFSWGTNWKRLRTASVDVHLGILQSVFAAFCIYFTCTIINKYIFIVNDKNQHFGVFLAPDLTVSKDPFGYFEFLLSKICSSDIFSFSASRVLPPKARNAMDPALSLPLNYRLHRHGPPPHHHQMVIPIFIIGSSTTVSPSWPWVQTQ